MADYAIAAELSVLDKASPALARVLDLSKSVAVQFDRIKDIGARLFAGTGASRFARQLGAVDDRLTAVTAAADAAASSLSTTFDAANAAAAKMTETVAALKGELASASAAARSLRVAPGGGRGGGSHGGVIGGSSGGFFSLPNLALDFTAWKALKLGAQEQLGIAYTELAAGLDPSSLTGAEYAKTIRDVAERASRGTVFSRPEVIAMMPGIAGMAGVPLEQALPFMPQAIRFGELEKQLGLATGHTISASESAGAAIQLSHLLGVTDPRKMEPILDKLIPATLTSHRTPAELVRVLQYEYGAAVSAHMSQSEAINLGALGAILMPGTRSGTALNSMLTGIMRVGPGAGTTISRGDKVIRAELQKMGLVDAGGALYRDKTGGTLLPLIQHLQAFEKQVGSQTAYADFVKVFNQRGARIASELARNAKLENIVNELTRREGAFSAMGGATGAQQKTMGNLANQAQRSLAGLETILADIGGAAVPSVTAAFKALNVGLDATRRFLDGNIALEKALAAGGGLAMIVAAARAMKGIGSVVSRVIGGGTAAAGEVAATVARPGILAAGGAAALTALAIEGYEWATDKFAPDAGKNRAKILAQTPDWLRWTRDIPDPMALLGMSGASTPDQQAAADKAAGQHKRIANIGSLAVGGALDHAAVSAAAAQRQDFLLSPIASAGKAANRGGGWGMLGELFASSTAAVGKDTAHQVAQSTQTGTEAGITKAAPGLAQVIAAAVHQALAGIAIHIDGDRVSQTVTDHQSKTVQKPPSDYGSFDTRLSPLFPAFGGM